MNIGCIWETILLNIQKSKPLYDKMKWFVFGCENKYLGYVFWKNFHYIGEDFLRMQFSERNKKTMYIGLAKVNRLTPREESLPGASGFNTQRTLSQWFCCKNQSKHKI